MKKLIFSLFIATLILSSVVLAVTNQNIQNKPAFSLMRRVIAETISEKDINSFKAQGCLIKHRLKDRTSLECPENVISKLNVREARIFHIMDLNADKQIGADKVWAEGITGTDVKVAILDTGIDTDHPELQDSYLGGYDFVNNDPYPEDDHGHGTHVAGIITSNGINANSKGVAPDAGIYMYKVCNANGNCYEDDMIAAMEAAVQIDAKVMSISIGGGSYTTENCDSDTLAAKVNWVVSQGLTAVVAAGNNGIGVSSPGCASGAISVGAVDSNNNVVYFSGRGPALDIVAPGYQIYSTLIGTYGTMSGTSMATPDVAGVVALLLEADSSLTTNEIKNALYDTASPVNKCYKCSRWIGSYCLGQIETTCTSDITGAGVVNAYEAYLEVKTTEPDSDGDGLPDSQDACPSTYGTFCNGCSEPTCVGCESPYCTAIDQPYCVDDDSNCIAQNAYGTCTAAECSFTCYFGYNDCNGDWFDGCEVNILFDNYNCGFCGNICEEVTCPSSGCGIGGCSEEEYGSYPIAQPSNCLNATCSGECTITCQYDTACDLDDDNDGVLDVEDACPTTYGTDCNGCPNPCSGCAVMSCDIGTLNPPTCVSGVCPDTVCPDNGCDVGACLQNEFGTYTPASNQCILNGNISTCEENPCTLSCVYDPVCEQPTVKCWSADYQYLYRNSNQMRKFCKCAEGNYGYNSYSYMWGRRTVYYYLDYKNNENWDATTRSSYLPVYQVVCTDGKTYATNQDYYK